jgi:hypothetical protein
VFTIYTCHRASQSWYCVTSLMIYLWQEVRFSESWTSFPSESGLRACYSLCCSQRSTSAGGFTSIGTFEARTQVFLACLRTEIIGGLQWQLQKLAVMLTAWNQCCLRFLGYHVVGLLLLLTPFSMRGILCNSPSAGIALYGRLRQWRFCELPRKGSRDE